MALNHLAAAYLGTPGPSAAALIREPHKNILRTREFCEEKRGGEGEGRQAGGGGSGGGRRRRTVIEWKVRNDRETEARMNDTRPTTYRLVAIWFAIEHHQP